MRDTRSWSERYGYPGWWVIALAAGVILFPVSIIVAFWSGNWEWLGITALLALSAWILTRA